VEQDEIDSRIAALEDKRRRERSAPMVVEMMESLPPPASVSRRAARAVRDHGGSVGLAAGFLALATQIVPLLKPNLSPEEAAAIKAEVRFYREERTERFRDEMNAYSIVKCREEAQEDRFRAMLPRADAQVNPLQPKPYRDDCPPIPVPKLPARPPGQ